MKYKISPKFVLWLTAVKGEKISTSNLGPNCLRYVFTMQQSFNTNQSDFLLELSNLFNQNNPSTCCKLLEIQSSLYQIKIDDLKSRSLFSFDIVNRGENLNETACLNTTKALLLKYNKHPVKHISRIFRENSWPLNILAKSYKGFDRVLNMLLSMTYNFVHVSFMEMGNCRLSIFLLFLKAFQLKNNNFLI